MAKVKPMDVTLPIACGVDVHKRFIVAVVCDASDPLHPAYFKKRFSTFTNDLIRFDHWLLEHDCRHVCMESTGKYWIPVFNVLESDMEEVRIVNPKWVKAIRDEKDDDKDAMWIVNKYRQGETKKSFIPDWTIRKLRELMRLRTKYVQQCTQEKNRLINSLTCRNYKLDMVFSSVFSKSAQKIINLLIGENPYTKEDILCCVDSRCRASQEDILEACNGFEFDAVEKKIIAHTRQHLQFLEEQIRTLDEEIDMLAAQYKKEIDLLMSVPGIGRTSAIKIIAEIGNNMDPFYTADKLARWAGLVPGRNESAGKKNSRHITKGGKYLKPVLVECAWAAIKAQNPYYRCKFNGIAGRQGKKRAIIAIARKILVSIWSMLKDGAEWHPKDMDDNGRPRELSLRKAKRNFKTVIRDLLDLGKTKEEIAIDLVTIINQS